MGLTLVLADDHPVVRQGLRAILGSEAGFRLLAEVASGPEVVRQVERLQPDVLVLDLMMPGLNGMEITRQVTQRSRRTRVVILSMHDNAAYIVEALRAGATAYVLKEDTAEELVQAIRAAAAGRRYLSAAISERGMEDYLARAQAGGIEPHPTITTREQEVLQLTAEGFSSTEVGARLYISPRTVETHRTNLMRKLNLRNQKDLIRYAVQRGLVPLEKLDAGLPGTSGTGRDLSPGPSSKIRTSTDRQPAKE